MKDNSGPAFPHLDRHYTGNGVVAVPGMTKRELIAMHLMSDAPGNRYEHAENAKWAKDAADALLAELAKE